jgi:para-nitrobenzyl esterase
MQVTVTSASVAICLAACTVSASGALAQPASPMIVKTEAGRVSASLAGEVLSFKGIPFADAPVGPLRWRAPQPAKPWSGVRAASDYGHDCMQIPFPSDAAPLGTTPAEDCLVLNIWRPAKMARKKLPVMVWIYGGGFVNGGSSPAVYDGSDFAKQGIVFVSFNYRLGRFGFFAHPALTAAREGPVGNFGLMDQVAALRWIRRNIAAFGGDPTNVTVFGESAGGVSITHLMGAPEAQGLFKRAGIMSGVGRGSVMGTPRRLSEDLPDLPSAETIGINFARTQGIEGTQPKALVALRALPATKVAGNLNLAQLFSGGDQEPPTWTGPFIDGITYLGTNEDLFARGAIAKVPIMVGATSADIGAGPFKTKDELFASFGEHAARARALYDPAGDLSFQRLAATVGADTFMVEPARYLADRFTAAEKPAWHYRFSYVAQSQRDQWSSGAPHATEIPYAFNTVGAKYGQELAPQDAATARAMHTYFANFAKTGDPNGSGLPAWPRYDSATRPVLDFTNDRGPVGGPDPWRERLDLIEARQAPAPPRTGEAGRD